MEYVIIAFLVLLGVLLVVAEILVLPGVSVAAIGAAAVFIWAIVLSYNAMGGVFALFVFFASFTLTIVALAFALRAKMLRKIALDKKITSSVADDMAVDVMVGDCGVAASRLAPVGSVEISGRHYQGRSRGELISQKSSIVVVAIEDGIVIVDINKI